MISVVGMLGLLVLCGGSLWLQHSIFRSRDRAADRREQAWLAERKELLDRIMYLSERPWSPPPEPTPSFIPQAEPELYWPEQQYMEIE